MKIFNVVLLLFFAPLSRSENITLTAEKNDLSNLISANFTCLETKLIDGEKYCLRESNITLNSCGPKTDWPCLEDKGCLNINQFIKN